MNQRHLLGTSKVQWFQGEKWLVLTSLFGFILAGICGVWVLLFGGHVSPEGDVARAFSFNAALGIFLLSTAAIIPVSGLRGRSRAVFRWGYIILALYSYFAETVQHFRGVNPRFVEDGTKFDAAVGNIFAFVALLLVLFYIFLASAFFRKKTYQNRPTMVLSIRYAMIATILSFAAGIWISVNQGRYVGLEGNIIWLHGLGFHALQAIPLVAWLAEKRQVAARMRHKLVHLTGVTFVFGLALIGLQTYMGASLFEWSVLPTTAAISFAASFASVPIIWWSRRNSSPGYQAGM